MPNYTEQFLFPSPKPNERADGPTGFQQLAQRVEDVLLMADVANLKAKVDAMDAVLRTPTVALTGFIDGIVLGNAIPNCYYRVIGTHAHVSISLKAAATDPTTKFRIDENPHFPLPFAHAGTNSAWGICFWNNKLGVLQVGPGLNYVSVFAVRQTDLNHLVAGAWWGINTWPANASLVGNVLIPI